MDLPPALCRLVQEQHRLASRPQLAAHGMTRGEIRWRLGRTWRHVLPGVVLVEPSPLTPVQRRMAALLYAGPHAWLAGPTAAVVHHFLPDDVDPRVHVLVPPTAKPRSVAWVTIRRTSLVDERREHRGPLVVSCRPRSVVDAAAALAPDLARALVIEVVHRRWVRLDDLVHWVESRQSAGRLRLRRYLEEAAAGAWSVPQADLARLAGTSRVLGPAWANPRLVDAAGRRLTTPDLWLDDVGMAIMVHSRQFHAGALQWDRTVEADADLAAHGVVVVGVTPGQLARDPRQVLARLEHLYLEASRQGRRTDVVAPPRAPWGHVAPAGAK